MTENPDQKRPQNPESISSKRKSDAKPQQAKRGRKKKVDEDFESDTSDDGIGNGKDGNNDGASTEVLIVGDTAENDAKLPEDLLKTYDREPGKLMVAGMVTWDLTGRRDPKGKVTNIRPNLYTFHRFTDETVSRQVVFF